MFSQGYVDIATAARALGKTTDAIRAAVRRNPEWDTRVVGTRRERRKLVRLSDLQRFYTGEVADRGW